MTRPLLYIGSDHAGFEVKKDLISHLETHGFSIEDCGAFNDDPSNYAIIAHRVSSLVQKTPGSYGILMCGTGIGASMAANRHAGIRAALCHDDSTVKSARAHNDANIIALGARVLDRVQILSYVDLFLKTPFEEGRHVERIQSIDEEG